MTTEKNQPQTLIVWFRRDLRVRDNQALFEACRQAQRVVPLFVFDDAILSREDTGPARVAFLLDALHILDHNLQSLGGQLILRRGQAMEQVLGAVQEFDADGVFFQREYEPYGRSRDAQVSKSLTKAGKICEKFPGLSLFVPEEIQSASGNPYTVFGPFKKTWFSCPADEPVPVPRSLILPAGAKSDAFPSASDLKFHTDQHFACGGEDAAQALLKEFVKKKIAVYETARDVLAEDGTSRLSRHLHFGTLGVRDVVAAVRAAGQEKPHRAFLTEIAWRDFYLHILWHFPRVAEGAFKFRLDAIRWENDPELFEAWTHGRTGYPIVDAAMRQLNAEAWMHNRGRMIVASFLTKDLLIDWRWGEQYFMKQLVDGDQASNNGGWQWAAGTGTDPQPFFRIFNPTVQGKKFDPDGDYVRRWVPELARVPSQFIHEPWRLSSAERDAVGAGDYPAPIVDHATQRDRALALYAAVGSS